MFCQESYETVTRTIETSCRMRRRQWASVTLAKDRVELHQCRTKRTRKTFDYKWITFVGDYPSSGMSPASSWVQERSRFCNSTDRFFLEFNVHYCLKFMVMCVCRRVPRTWVKQRGYAPACLWKATKMSWNRFTEAVRQLQLNSTWAQ